jgi:hypothetical protein
MLTSTANTLLALALVAGGSVNALPQRWGHANGVVTTTTVAVPAPSPVVSIPAPVSVPPAYGGGESHKVEVSHPPTNFSPTLLHVHYSPPSALVPQSPRLSSC